MSCDKRCFDESGKPLPLTEDMNCDVCYGKDAGERPADLPEAGASAERISSVVRSNATLKQKYLSLCNEFGFKPASIGSGDDVKDIIQQSWSMADEFVRKLTELLKS